MQMRRTPFKIKRTAWRVRPQKALRRTKLRIKGISTTSQDKEEIQALLRSIVIVRDKGCVLRKLRHCSKELDLDAIYQADHLITRSNSATYADSRLVVCVCKGCHFWKKYHEKEYDKLVKSILSKERIALWERCEEERASHRAHKMDWKLEKLNLYNELAKLTP